MFQCARIKVAKDSSKIIRAGFELEKLPNKRSRTRFVGAKPILKNVQAYSAAFVKEANQVSYHLACHAHEKFQMQDRKLLTHIHHRCVIVYHYASRIVHHLI